MHVIQILSLDHLRKIQETEPYLLQSCRPMTCDLSVSFTLREMNIEFIDEWNFLTEIEIKANWDLAHELAEYWSQQIYVNSTDFSVKANGVLIEDLIYPIEAALNARTVYAKLFQANSIQALTIVSVPPTAIIRTGPKPTTLAAHAVSQSILRLMAEGLRIPVRIISFPSVGCLTPKAPVSWKFVFKNRVKWMLCFLSALLPWKEKVLLHTASMSASDRLIVDEMIRQSKFQLIPMPFLSSEFRQSGSIEFNALVDDVEKRLSDSIGKYRGEYPELFANSYLMFQWLGLAKELIASTMATKELSKILRFVRPKALVFGHETFAREKLLVRTAHAHSLFTVSLVHGALIYKFSFRGLVGESARFLVLNKAFVDGLSRYGVPKNKIMIQGCPGVIGEGDVVKPPEAIRTLKLNHKRAKVVVITAGVTTGYASPVANPSKHVTALEDLRKLMESRQDLDFVLKPHPSFDYTELYMAEFSGKSPNITVAVDASLPSVLAEADICLLINYVTTAALEAFARGIPVIYLNNGVWPLEEWESSLSSGVLPEVSQINELAQLVKQLLEDREYRAKVVRVQHNEFLKNYSLGEFAPKEKFDLYDLQKIDGTHVENFN